MFVALFNSNLVVSARQVNSTEHLRFTKLIEQVMDTRDWKHDEACLFIQASKVNTHSKLCCLFPHKQDRGTIWRDAGANLALCQHVIYMLLNYFKFIGRQTVLLVARGGGIFIYQINGMVKCQVLCEEPNQEFETHPETYHTKQHTMHQSGLPHPQTLSGHHMALLEQANKWPLVQIAQ